MKASIERERFLAALHIRSGRDSDNKDQIPTVGRYGTRDNDECMRSEQEVEELVLSRRPSRRLLHATIARPSALSSNRSPKRRPVVPIFHRDVAQYSEAYDRLKLGIPTSSNFHKIVTPQGKPSRQWREYACVLIAERILQRKIEFYKFASDGAGPDRRDGGGRLV
jgi:hypothetical protein